MKQNKESGKKERIGTLDSLKSDKPDSDEEHDRPQNFFAGGSKTSGILVEGNRDPSNASFVQNIINRMTEMSRNSDHDHQDTFTGRAYHLSNQPSSTDPIHLNSATRYITIYRNGFLVSLDNSDQHQSFYSYENPQNQMLLQSILAGHAPPTLLDVKYGQQVDLQVTNKGDQDYQSRTESRFQGSGHRLGAVGSPTPIQQQNSSSTRYISSLNQNLPTTQLQIRLLDGSRLIGRFNHHHTIQDIQEFIALNNPPMSCIPYALQTSTITDIKILSKKDETLEEAGLVNTTIVQRRLE